MAAANLAIRFFLELAGVAAAAFWGFHLGDTATVHWLAGVAAPVLVVVVWARVMAPNARNSLGRGTRIVLGTGLLLLTAAGLGLAGQPSVAVLLGAAILLNAALMGVLGTEAFGTQIVPGPSRRTNH